VELCIERREGKFGRQEDSVPFGLLRTAHLHHIPSQMSPPPLVISVFKPFVLVLCVTDGGYPTLRNIRSTEYPWTWMYSAVGL
jgi:hypothetical protein